MTTEVHPGPATAVTSTGLRIHVDPADARGQQLVASHGDFNPLSRVLWHRTLGLHDWQVVLDVGVNYGEMLVGAPIPPSARVVGFEPNRALHPFLQRTLAENGLDIELRAEALSDRFGTATFNIDQQWSGTSSLIASDPPESPTADEAGRWAQCQVDLATLDSVVVGGGQWCAKVDVEGLEVEVLAGAVEAMAAESMWAVMLEVLHLPAFAVANLAHAHSMFLLDRRTHALVRLPGGNAQLARELLKAGWLYPQDCLLLSPALADSLDAL